MARPAALPRGGNAPPRLRSWTPLLLESYPRPAEPEEAACLLCYALLSWQEEAVVEIACVQRLLPDTDRVQAASWLGWLLCLMPQDWSFTSARQGETGRVRLLRLSPIPEREIP